MTSSSQEVLPFDVEAPNQPQYIQHFYNDYDLVLKAFAHWHVDITEFLDPEFQEFSDQFKNLSGNQLSNIIGSILACGGSTFAYSMNGAIASQCTSLTPVLRALIATSPLAVGGVLRILSASHADEGWGKNNILLLLSLSVLGMAMNIAILQYIDLPTLAPHECWPLILAGVFIGLGLGTYASGMILGTRSASNVSTEVRRNNLTEISNILTRALVLRGDIPSTQTIRIEPDFISNHLSFILHKNAGVYSAVIAGIANASPFIPITINANSGSLSNTEIISLLAGLQILIMLGISLFLQNPIYDQLLKSMKQATPEQVRRLALYGGQTLFPSALSIKEEFSQLTPEEIKGLWIAVIFYSASYGVLLSLSTTGVSTMMSKCLTRVESSSIIARTMAISSVFRAIPLLLTSVRPTRLTQVSLLVMSMAMAMFATVDYEGIPESMMYLYGVFCGIVCFAVVARLVEKIPNKVGIVTGASSGIGAFAGLPFSLIMAWIQDYNPQSGVCQSGAVHETMSFQLFLPVLVSVMALLTLLVPACNRSMPALKHRFTHFKPVPREIEEIEEAEVEQEERAIELSQNFMVI